MSEHIVVSGIGTDVGKTVVSAILVEAHNCSYWKPVQAGDLNNSDSMKINNLCSNATILPEKFKLNTAASPHLAATIDGVHISQADLNLPESENKLLIEGAGGLLVPINNDGLLYADVIQIWGSPLVLVSRHYLGSINHTLLSLQYLQQKQIPLAMLIWVGAENQATESIVKKLFPQIRTHRIPETRDINPTFIREEAKRFPCNIFEINATTL